jgi:hypothetical protein
VIKGYFRLCFPLTLKLDLPKAIKIHFYVTRFGVIALRKIYLVFPHFLQLYSWLATKHVTGNDIFVFISLVARVIRRNGEEPIRKYNTEFSVCPRRGIQRKWQRETDDLYFVFQFTQWSVRKLCENAWMLFTKKRVAKHMHLEWYYIMQNSWCSGLKHIYISCDKVLTFRSDKNKNYFLRPKNIRLKCIKV